MAILNDFLSGSPKPNTIVIMNLFYHKDSLMKINIYLHPVHVGAACSILYVSF